MSVAAEPSGAPIALGVGFKPQLQRWNTFTVGNRAQVTSAADRHTDLNAEPRTPLTVSRDLSIIEIETRLRECLRTKYSDVLQAFQNYDDSRSMSVSKGQLRRVLELHCLPLTSQQFDAILNKTGAASDGTIRYCDFLDKFCGANTRVQSADRWKGVPLRCDSATVNNGEKTDIIEKMLQDKIQSRLPDVLESLRLHDFSRDGTVQRHILHRVLDRQCFELSEDQFDRIYQKYDLRRNGTVNYKEFLSRLGVRFENGNANRNGTVVIGNRPSSVRVSSALSQNVKIVPLSEAELYEVEVEFRKKMRDNFANVKRMFMAFDRHLDGFISLEDLKSVLNNFTVPMSDQLFSDLMARFGIKASGKLSWEFFLSKFQDPLAERNGQTLPIKPSHKFFPNRGADEDLQFPDVVKLLVKRMKSGYSTMKDAFLQLDKNRDGRISRKELRELLEKTFSFRLTSEHFNELMLLLDAQKTNSISYQDFLDLFEQRESLGGHKWLNTCHRTNAHKRALIAWSTLEGNIRDQIELHRSDVIHDLERFDVEHRGWVTLKVLRKVIERHAVAVTDEHFRDMVNRLAVLDEVGLVNYVAFFLAIGVMLKPDDSHGVSSQITDGSKQTAEYHRADQQNRLLDIEQRASDRACVMDPDEILTRLRDKMAQKTSDLSRTFRYYSSKHRGRITKKDFRKILESFGFHLPNEQFEDLCKQLNFCNGHMNYTDFVRCFETRRPWSPTNSGENARPPNHRVNEIRGDELGLSTDELESRLRQKFDGNFDNLHDVFKKFDTNNDGILTKSNFRNMLNSFMLVTTDEEFDKFCAKLGIDRTSRITYQDFINVFQLHETKEGHTWLTSTHRFNQVREASNLGVNETRSALKRKLYESSHDLAEAFRSMAAKRQNGTITRSDLSKVLSRFSLKLNKGGLDEMWTDIDVDGQGSISYNDFMQYLMADEFTPGDADGISRRIMKENRDTLKELRRDQVRRQQENQLNEAHQVFSLSTDDVIDILRNHFQDQFVDLQAAFKQFDSNNKGYLTSKDFQNILGRLNLLIDDDQLFDLYDRLNLRTNKAKMSFDEFVRIFEEGRAETFKVGQVEDAKYPIMQSNWLSDVEIETRLRQKVDEQLDVLLSACRSFDQKETGLLRTIDLRRVLDMFFLKLTDDHFRHVMKIFSSTKLPYEASMIDYKLFLEKFKSQNDKKIADSLSKSQSVMVCDTAEELLAIVRNKVADRVQAVETSFTDVDFADLGVVQMRDFRDVLGMHGVILNDEQFTRLWSILPVNEFSNLDYRAFLSQCIRVTGGPDAVRPATSEIRPTSTSLVRERTRPNTSDSTISRAGSAMSRQSVLCGRPYTPLVNAESSEAKVLEKVRSQWQSLQKDCRQLDVDNTGVVNQQEFRELCLRYNFGLTEDETLKLLLKYDLKNNATFSYVDFIRHFVLPSSARDAVNGGRSARYLRRRLDSGPNVLQVSSVDETPAPPALEKIRGCIVGSWKTMRRDLRAVDPSGLASTDQFRQALRNVNVDIDEEEFFDIAVHFEDRKTKKIKYDDFFRYFLQRS